MPQLLRTDFTEVLAETGDKIFVCLIGVGGTGAHLAYKIAHKLAFTNKDVIFAMVDGDLVEDKNLLRQKFIQEDVGHSKVDATSQKCIAAYKKDILAIDKYIKTKDDLIQLIPFGYFPIFLGASDSLKLRYTVCEAIKDLSDCVYIDGGNNDIGGQVIFTYKRNNQNITPDYFTEFFSQKSNEEIMAEVNRERAVDEHSCAEPNEPNEQTELCNMYSAIHIFAFLSKILDDKPISTRLVYFNTDSMNSEATFI